MRLQVRALSVGLATASESASVRRRPFPRPGPATPLWLGVHRIQRGGRRGEQDPLTGRRLLLLHAHGGVLPEHAGELVVVVVVVRHHGERYLHPRVCVREFPGRAPVVCVVEALRERQRCGVAVLGLMALGVHQVVRAQRRRHAAQRGLSRLLLVRHHAGDASLVLDFGAALRHQTHGRSIRVHGDWLHFNVRMLRK